MDPNFVIALMQVEHRARIAQAERYGHHAGAMPRARRRPARLAWPRLRAHRPRRDVLVAPAA
jgi:hypothetical protein